MDSRVVWNTRETSMGPARGTVGLENILVRENGVGECSVQVGNGVLWSLLSLLCTAF